MSFGLQAFDNKGRLYRACVSGMLVAVLAFPPNMLADDITWNGGTGNYSDPTNWTCAPTCTNPTFPNNGTDNKTFAAVINSGTGDSVTLDTPGIINSLRLGGSGTSAPSTLIASGGPSLTLGDHDTDNGSVLRVSNGGILNIDTNSAVTLELSSGADAIVSRGGAINVGNNGSLVLHNDSGYYSQLANYGSINVNSGGSLVLSDGGNASTFDLTGRGTLTLAGGQIIGTSGTENLENDSRIVGNGTIAAGMGSFTNYGTVQASGGLLKVDAPNLDLDSDTLYNGSYKASNGATLQLSSLGGDKLNTISGGSISVYGSGLVTGDGTTNALTGLQNVSGGLTLGSGAALTIDASAATFEAYGGSVKVLGGSTLDLSNLSFGANGNYTIDNGSTIKYSGADISSLDSGSSLTLIGNGQLLNTSPTANPGGLGATLSYVTGELSLQGGANLAITSQVFNTIGEGQPNGQVSVTGGSTLDLTGTSWGNESVGTLRSGDFTVGDGSTLTYAGKQINTIDYDASLSLSGTGKLVNTNSLNPDPLSDTLSTVNGYLSLAHGSSLTLTGAQQTFTVGDYAEVDLDQGASLNLAAVTFTNEQNGVLTSGAFSVGDASTLTYAGNDITEIGGDAFLHLGGSGKIVNSALGPDHDAISNTLTTVNGFLAVTDHATLALTQAVTNYGGDAYGDPGFVVAGHSKVIAANGLTNASTESSAPCGCSGSAVMGFESSAAFITGGLNNISSSTSSYEYPTSTIYATDHSYISTDSLLNQATLTTGDGFESSYSSPQAVITLDSHSVLAVSGNATNAALSTNGDSADYASLRLDTGSKMTVGGTFTNDGGAGLNKAELVLENYSKATVTGLFSNVGGANVLLDTGQSFETFNGGSTLNTNGGFVNDNSTVSLGFNSTLNANGVTIVTGPANPLDDNQTVYGFANQSTDNPNSFSHTALLQLGYSPVQPESEGGNEGQFGGSTANITGGLLNSATSSNGGYTNATVSVDNASLLNADFVINSATAMTASDGGSDYAAATITVQDGSTMHVTGSLNNGTYVLNGSVGSASAAVNALYDSTIAVDGGMTNYNSSATASFGSSLNVGNGFANTADDQNSTGGSGMASLGMQFGGTTTVTGGLTNSATTSSNGFANTQITAQYGSQLHVDSLTNTASNAVGDTGTAQARITLETGSALTVDGNVTNTYTPSVGGSGFASISLDQSTLTVGGTFTNTNASLTMTGQSYGTVYGLFTNDINSVVTLDQSYAQTSFEGQGFGSTLNTNGFQNDGAVNLNLNSTLTNTGAFTNTGSVSIMNGSSLSVNSLYGDPVGDQLPPVIIPGTLTNTGTITTGGVGLNSINVTGDVFNTSPGVINLQSFSDVLSVTGQFTNSGSLGISGGNAAVWAGSISNLAGGHITVTGDNVGITAGSVTNSGAISVTGSFANVSASDLTNTNKGTVTIGGTGNLLQVLGKLTNEGSMSVSGDIISGTITVDSLDQSGTLTIGPGGAVDVTNTFRQTAGETSIAADAALVASLIEISGGTLSGDGTIHGNVLIDGGTLAPGDPMSIDIVGNYNQTLLGILDLDFASADDYDSINVFSDPKNPDLAGNVTLGGTLELNLEDGFGLGVDLDTVFHIMSWTGLRLDNSDFNTFDNLTFLNSNNQLLTFKEVFSDHGLDLDVVAATQVSDAPEPSSVSMVFGVLLLAAGAELIRRRRKVNAVS